MNRILPTIALWLLTTVACMAQGTSTLALSQVVDLNGKPLVGALLYTYVVGTIAQPQNTFQDTGLSILNPWPLQADQNGRLPMFYMANGSVHIRLTDANGTPQYDNPSVLVIGASGGGGGGANVDPTTVLSTGDLKAKYGTGPLSGFVRLNGLTIGSATSGATERANADTQSLFIYLYNADPNLAVSGGRGASALADYSANKTITLPDWRGRSLTALDDMGNSAAGRLTATYFGTGATTLGASGGAQSTTLITSNLPAYTPSGSFTATSTYFHGSSVVSTTTGTAGVNFDAVAAGSGTLTTPTASLVGTAQGGTSLPFSSLPPAMLTTFYIKL
jgi:hypothetical protein